MARSFNKNVVTLNTIQQVIFGEKVVQRQTRSILSRAINEYGINRGENKLASFLQYIKNGYQPVDMAYIKDEDKQKKAQDDWVVAKEEIISSIEHYLDQGDEAKLPPPIHLKGGRVIKYMPGEIWVECYLYGNFNPDDSR